MRTDLPPDLEIVRDKALRALGPVKPASSEDARRMFPFFGDRTNGGRQLPPYHLVYFTLVELCGFRNLGRFEKLAWAIPIDVNGRAFTIEHRKFGVGVFAPNPEQSEADARAIVEHVHKAVKAARPFFDWLAARAIEESAVNVANNSGSLFDRFDYFREEYRAKVAEAEARKTERIVKEGTNERGGKWQTISHPATELRMEARWLGLSAIEAFFSWTEHVLIHIGILRGALTTANDVARSAQADWAAKFKVAFDLTDPRSKELYDALLVVRKELRNFVAHGSFGKNGEAFRFHSSAGAVPVLLPDPSGSRKFSFGQASSFDIDRALVRIEEFIAHLWDGPRAPAKIYIQEYQLPLIMTMVADGTYRDAMASVDEMTLFVRHLAGEMDNAANMDW